ncbi:SRPBCC family protein [Streptomyces sp. NPDC049813]|uniref:SRPBCC family protein n=1 Tax=Streptomyces sp. NPDC049813 TaxID=3365597 RepID=UPI0037B7EAA0
MAENDRNESAGSEESGLGRLKEELSKFAGAQVQSLADKAGDKLTGLTDKLNDSAENPGSLTSIGSRVLQGESPVKALISGKAKGAKDAVVDKAKEAFGGGGKGKRKSGDTKVMNIIEVLDVGVPLRTAYDAWTQYDQFSGFAKGVRDVSKGDETQSDWKVKVGPSSRSFKATVQEQIPDDRIVWTSEGAKGTTRGAVSFHELGPTLTRIVLVVEYYPSGFFEKTGNLWRAQGRRMRLDFKHFQRYVTLTEDEPEGWRGEIRDGEVVLSHEDAVEQEEAENAETDDNDDGYEDGYDEDGEDGEDGEYADEDDEDAYDDEDDPEGRADRDEDDDVADAYEDEDDDAQDDDDEDEEEEEEEPDEEEPPAPRRTGRKRRAGASR